MGQMSLQTFVSNINVMKAWTPKKDDLKQQAKADSLLDSDDHSLEEKYDGIRGKTIAGRAFSKENNDKTDNFPHTRDFFLELGQPNLILDGEYYYPGETSQYCIQVTNSNAKAAVNTQLRIGYIHYVVYDILRLPNGNWTVQNTNKERRKLLEYWYHTYVRGTPMEEYIHISNRWGENKRYELERLLAEGKEGGILKQNASTYLLGQKPAWKWIKFKAAEQADLFIIGYDDPTVLYGGGNYENWPYWKDVDGISRPVTKSYFMDWVGSLKLGAYVDGEVVQITTVSGMDEPTRAQVSSEKDAYMNKVVRVNFMEYTTDGYPRHPSFHNWHEDKAALDCTWDFNVGRRG